MDLRQKELNEKITEFEDREKVLTYDLRDTRVRLKYLREELKVHMDKKQGELI